MTSLPHIHFVTPLYHILEVSLVSASSDQFVGHRLISFLPGSVRISNYSVLTGRGNLEQTTVVKKQQNFFDGIKKRPFHKFLVDVMPIICRHSLSSYDSDRDDIDVLYVNIPMAEMI